jgi:chromate transporter
MIAIAESTPGPIAINSATFIGYKLAGFFGSLVATLGVSLPSFIIIYIISLFFNQFLEIAVVANAFKGIQVCVCYLILSAGIKMIKKMKKQVLPIIITSLVGILLITFTLISVKFSSIFYILGGAIIGLFTYLYCVISKKSPDFLKEKEGDK